MKCVILDDEPFAHQVLEHYIGETPGLSLVAGFRNAVDAYAYLAKHKIDLLFLDIEMPLINGIGFLKALSNPPKTIFTTAHKQYAFDGFELDAVDYLLKPFSYERFVKAVSKAKEPGQIKEATNFLMIKDKDSLRSLKQNDIIYVEGLKDYMKIITIDKTHIIHHTLKGLLQKLDHTTFIQVHRSFIVNKQYIGRIHHDSLILSDQSVIPIGPSYRKNMLVRIR